MNANVAPGKSKTGHSSCADCESCSEYAVATITSPAGIAASMTQRPLLIAAMTAVATHTARMTRKAKRNFVWFKAYLLL